MKTLSSVILSCVFFSFVAMGCDTGPKINIYGFSSHDDGGTAIDAGLPVATLDGGAVVDAGIPEDGGLLPGNEGQSCYPNSTCNDQDNLACDHDKCVQWGDLGELCQPGTKACHEDLTCINSTCQKWGDLGEPCKPGTNECHTPNSLSCFNGTCQAWGEAGQPCKSGTNECHENLTCVPSSLLCEDLGFLDGGSPVDGGLSLGNEGQFCYPNDTCNDQDNLTCNIGRCVQWGDLGEQCKPGTNECHFSDTLTCIQGICHTWGDLNEPCKPGTNECHTPDSLACFNGACQEWGDSGEWCQPATKECHGSLTCVPASLRCEDLSFLVPDGGSLPDGGALPDGGNVADGGVPPDGGSQSDGGNLPDGGSVVDGGNVEDGGAFADGGAVPSDGGSIADGGAIPSDGGVSPDGGAVADGGLLFDGGSAIDGGLIPSDGGSLPDGGSADDGGTFSDGGAAVDGGNFADGGPVADGGVVSSDGGVASDGGVSPRTITLRLVEPDGGVSYLEAKVEGDISGGLSDQSWDVGTVEFISAGTNRTGWSVPGEDSYRAGYPATPLILKLNRATQSFNLWAGRTVNGLIAQNYFNLFAWSVIGESNLVVLSDGGLVIERTVVDGGSAFAGTVACSYIVPDGGVPYLAITINGTVEEGVMGYIQPDELTVSCNAYGWEPPAEPSAVINYSGPGNYTIPVNPNTIRQFVPRAEVTNGGVFSHFDLPSWHVGGVCHVATIGENQVVEWAGPPAIDGGLHAGTVNCVHAASSLEVTINGNVEFGVKGYADSWVQWLNVGSDQVGWGPDDPQWRPIHRLTYSGPGTYTMSLEPNTGRLNLIAGQDLDGGIGLYSWFDQDTAGLWTVTGACTVITDGQGGHVISVTP